MKRECLKIIGTAHVSQESADEVREAILEEQPDVVAIELCLNRYTRMRQEMEGIETNEEVSAKQIIKDNNVGLYIASGILSYIQGKIGDDLGVEAGSEMIAAIETADEIGAKIALIDRDINITLKRALNQMSVWEKIKIGFSLIGSLFTDEDKIDVEELKKEDTIAEVLEYFQEKSPKAYNVLVHERNAFLANGILSIPEDKVIVVIGAGHKDGINHFLDNPGEIPPINELTSLGKKGIPWTKIILAAIPILFVVIFFLSFINGISIHSGIIEFILLACGLAFIGSLLSGSKLQSAIVGGLVAPLTIIHPLLAAGWFSGIMEAKYRKVHVKDIAELPKSESLKDLWNNNLFRILLVVVGTNIGASIATFVSIPEIFIPLLMKLFGM